MAVGRDASNNLLYFANDGGSPGYTSSIIIYKKRITGVVVGGGGTTDTAEQIRDKLQTLTDDDRLDATAIKNLPSGGGSGDDAFDWATVGNTDLVPNDKLPASAKRSDSAIQTLARGQITEANIPNTITRDTELNARIDDTDLPDTGGSTTNAPSVASVVRKIADIPSGGGGGGTNVTLSTLFNQFYQFLTANRYNRVGYVLSDTTSKVYYISWDDRTNANTNRIIDLDQRYMFSAAEFAALTPVTNGSNLSLTAGTFMQVRIDRDSIFIARESNNNILVAADDSPISGNFKIQTYTIT